MHDHYLRLITSLEGWCPPDKAAWLYHQVIQHGQQLARPLAAVEVGVFGGRSLIAVALALRDIGKGFITGIDPYTNADALVGMTGADKDTVAHRDYWGKINMPAIHRGAEHALASLALNPFAAILRAPSERCVHLFADGSLDFVHVDGNHHCAMRDVQQWLPKLRPGGIFVLDDTDWPEVQEARKAVRDWGLKLLHLGDGCKWEAVWLDPA